MLPLLNIGSEELKGNETIKETFKIMNEKKSDDFNFSGYIEGNESNERRRKCYYFRWISQVMLL